MTRNENALKLSLLPFFINSNLLILLSRVIFRSIFYNIKFVNFLNLKNKFLIYFVSHLYKYIFKQNNILTNCNINFSRTSYCNVLTIENIDLLSPVTGKFCVCQTTFPSNDNLSKGTHQKSDRVYCYIGVTPMQFRLSALVIVIDL